MMNISAKMFEYIPSPVISISSWTTYSSLQNVFKWHIFSEQTSE